MVYSTISPVGIISFAKPENKMLHKTMQETALILQMVFVKLRLLETLIIVIGGGGVT